MSLLGRDKSLEFSFSCRHNGAAAARGWAGVGWGGQAAWLPSGFPQLAAPLLVPVALLYFLLVLSGWPGLCWHTGRLHGFLAGPPWP